MATGTAATALPTTLRDRVAGDVRALLARRRISGNALAVQLGLSQKWVSRRLSGEVPFDLDDLELIANALDVEISVLLGLRGAQPMVPKVAPALTLVPEQRRATGQQAAVTRPLHIQQPLLRVVSDR